MKDLLRHRVNSTEECTALNHVSCGYVPEAKKKVGHNESYNTPYDSRSQICYKSGYCDSGEVYGKKEVCYKHCVNVRTRNGRISLKHGQTSKSYYRSCSGRYTGGGSGRYTCNNGTLSGGPPGCKHDPGGGGGAGSSCFTAETKILMGDNSELEISKVKVGDCVLGQDGALNVVVDIERVPLGSRQLHSFNGSKHFITSEHPVKTTQGWKSFSPEATYYEHFIDVSDIPPGFNDEPLTFGDTLVRVDGLEVLEQSLPPIKIENRSVTVYNLRLEAAPGSSIHPDDDRSHTYFANGYLVHNK